MATVSVELNLQRSNFQLANIRMTNFLQEKSNILYDPKTPEEAFEVKLLRALEYINMSLMTQISPETPQAKTFKI